MKAGARHVLGRNVVGMRLLSALRQRLSPAGRSDFWDAIGRTLARWGKPRMALAFYRRATAAHGTAIHTWLHRAAASVRAGDLDEAALCYRALVQLDSDNPRSALRLAGIYEAIGAGQPALTVCQQALRRFPEAVSLHRQLGRLLLNSGSVDGALRAFRRAAELNPLHCDTQYYVAMALKRVGRTCEARETLRKAMSLRPSDPKLYYALGMCCSPTAEAKESAELLLAGLSVEQATQGLTPVSWGAPAER